MGDRAGREIHSAGSSPLFPTGRAAPAGPRAYRPWLRTIKNQRQRGCKPRTPTGGSIGGFFACGSGFLRVSGHQRGAVLPTESHRGGVFFSASWANTGRFTRFLACQEGAVGDQRGLVMRAILDARRIAASTRRTDEILCGRRVLGSIGGCGGGPGGGLRGAARRGARGRGAGRLRRCLGLRSRLSAPRSRCRVRAAATRRRTEPVLSPAGPPSSSGRSRGTRTRTSKRSRNGPDSLRRYLATTPSGQSQPTNGSPRKPHGHGFVAATTCIRHGNRTEAPFRAMTTCPSSIG